MLAPAQARHHLTEVPTLGLSRSERPFATRRLKRPSVLRRDPELETVSEVILVEHGEAVETAEDAIREASGASPVATKRH